MRTFQTSDGYDFYLQPDGRLTDNPDALKTDMSFDSLEEFTAANPDHFELFGDDSVMPITTVFNALPDSFEHVGDLADYIGSEGLPGICLALTGSDIELGNQVGFERIAGFWNLVVWGDLSNRSSDERVMTIPSTAAANAHPVVVAEELARLVTYVATLKHVGTYFRDMLGERFNDRLRGVPLDSFCGEECVKVIDAAKALMNASDASLTADIERIANSACEIICFA